MPTSTSTATTKPKSRRKPSTSPVQVGDLRGIAQLGIDATVGITDMVESLHHTITSFSGLTGPGPKGKTRGVTGMVYRSIRGTTEAVGVGLDAVLGLIPGYDGVSNLERDASVAALNGIWGDHLAETGNPLAIEMQLRVDGKPYATATRAPTNKLVVLVHGLVMNDRQWRRNGHDHGQSLADDLGYTPLYLHYNSGQHISQNGREFSEQLDELVTHWPVPVKELVLVGHSMGGLVARSACHYGEGSKWIKSLTDLVFLGTPHGGAPLERGGKWVDQLLSFSPYLAPFARLGKTRSDGINDLGFSHLLDTDWANDTDGNPNHSMGTVLPLPSQVRAYVVAATQSNQQNSLHSAMMGDGLVPVASALGDAKDPARALKIPEANRMVVTGANHWDVLDRNDVYQQLKTWLAR